MKRFRTILKFAPRYRRAILLGFVCLLTARCLQLMVPDILGDAVSDMEATYHRFLERVPDYEQVEDELPWIPSTNFRSPMRFEIRR